MVLAGKRCRSGSVGSGRINVTLCGIRVQTVVVLQARAACAWRNPGMGTRWVVSQDAMGATVVQAEPCRIMAHSSGWTVPMMAARGAGTSGRRPR